MSDSPEPPNAHDCVKDGTTRSTLCNRRIAHTINVKFSNNRYINCTIEIRPELKTATIYLIIVHRRILDVILGLHVGI